MSWYASELTLPVMRASEVTPRQEIPPQIISDWGCFVVPSVGRGAPARVRTRCRCGWKSRVDSSENTTLLQSVSWWRRHHWRRVSLCRSVRIGLRTGSLRLNPIIASPRPMVFLWTRGCPFRASAAASLALEREGQRMAIRLRESRAAGPSAGCGPGFFFFLGCCGCLLARSILFIEDKDAPVALTRAAGLVHPLSMRITAWSMCRAVRRRQPFAGLAVDGDGVWRHMTLPDDRCVLPLQHTHTFVPALFR